MPERTPSAPWRDRATRRRLSAIRTIAPRQTRTRPSLPSFLRNMGPGSSGTLPTLGPLELLLHRHPGETSWRPSHLPTRKKRAPRSYTRSRRTNFPPWSERAGAPGEGQCRPTIPTPRRLQGVLPSCNNNWNGTIIRMKPNKSPKNRPLFTEILNPIFVFNPSIYNFILNFISSLLRNTFAIFPRKALLWQSTAERKKEWKEKKIKYSSTIPFISFARFLLHLNRLNKLKKITYPKIIFSKCFELLINYLMKVLRLGFHWNIVLRCAMYATVRK